MTGVSLQARAPCAVVFDVEFTAWEGSLQNGWIRPSEYRELLQIGAVKVDSGFAPIAEFERVVRPRLNPDLSAYIEKLTGLTNEDVRRRGVDYVEARNDFVAFAAGLPVLSFGRDDLIFAENERLYGLKRLPPMPPWADLRFWLKAQGIDVFRGGFHACDVGPAAGVPFAGHRHDALADARSVAAGVAALIARGATPPEPP